MFAHLHMEVGKPHEITNVIPPISMLSFSVFALAPSVMCLKLLTRNYTVYNLMPSHAQGAQDPMSLW
jgi:hypothetical protein